MKVSGMELIEHKTYISLVMLYRSRAISNINEISLILEN